MKQILFLFIFSLITLTVFAQSQEGQSNQWDQTIKEIKAQVDLKVFPNPCTGQKLTVETDNGELIELKISNIVGKVVMLKKFLAPVKRIEINLYNTPNGIYLLQAKTPDNKIVAKKLIVSGR